MSVYKKLLVCKGHPPDPMLFKF